MEAVTVKAELCNGCGDCLVVCTAEAIRMENGKAVIGPECIVCLACVDICPTGAILEPEVQPGPRLPLPVSAQPVRAWPQPSGQSWPVRPGPPARADAGREPEPLPRESHGGMRGRRGLWRR